jgi:hypothetical protein
LTFVLAKRPREIGGRKQVTTNFAGGKGKNVPITQKLALSVASKMRWHEF